MTNIASWHLFGFGSFTIFASDGEIIGGGGLFRMERDIEPPIGDTPEASWSIAPGWQGLGYASESMSAILRWFDETIRIRRTVCIIDSGNAPSERLAVKLGYAPVCRGRYRDAVVMTYAREI